MREDEKIGGIVCILAGPDSAVFKARVSCVMAQSYDRFTPDGSNHARSAVRLAAMRNPSLFTGMLMSMIRAD